MPHDSESLWVEVETWSPYRPQRILHGRISLDDYHALRAGLGPAMVRLEECQNQQNPCGPIQDLFLSNSHILSITPADQVA
ncbi:hypothetical protein HNP46_004124 [Pseudomonas nitritireducens]|uniref:Uncharacterized protein n=1 Tax=Pseudomonas nitroreducens TaxID=46680 RepID=A0A7W7KM03_PSENT|nr:hypothetical protein [Pseudomonas nitritireducens]MBB4865244.1 hypothetical protein [Pseudomonas nitritireducens]